MIFGVQLTEVLGAAGSAGLIGIFSRGPHPAMAEQDSYGAVDASTAWQPMVCLRGPAETHAEIDTKRKDMH